MVAMPISSAQSYFDSADVVMIVVSNDELVIDVNRKGCEFLGLPKDKILGKNWFDNFVPGAMRENTKRVFHDMLNSSLRHVHSEYPILKKRGEEVVVNWHNIISSDESGNTIGVLSSATDVTEQRRAEEAMQKIENRLQTALDSMLEGYQIIDFDWRYAYINESAAKQGRRTRRELIGHTMMEMYPGIENTDLFRYLREGMDKRIPHQMENEFVFPDGSKGWFELRIEPVPEGVLVLSMDITKRKQLEDELEKYRLRLEQVVAERTAECSKVNEQLVREIEEHRKVEEGLMLRAMILDNAREIIFLVSSRGDFTYANEAASRTYGYGQDEFLNLNIRQLLRPEDEKVISARLEEVIEKGQVDTETVHVRKDGSFIRVKVHHSLVKTLHGQFIISVIREAKD